MIRFFSINPARSLMLCFAFVVVGGAGEPDTTANRKAARFVETGQCVEALALVEATPGLIESEPDSRILLGRIYLGMGRYAEAEAKLSPPGATAGEPLRLEALAQLAEARGNLDRSIAFMTQAVAERQKTLTSTEPLDVANALAESRSLLGAIAFRAGRLDTAKDQFQQAIALVGEAHAKLHAINVPHDERDPRLFAGSATAGLARVYGALGDAARAERSWRAIMARTDDPEILLNLAAFYLARNDAKSAQRHLDRALRLTEGKPIHRGTRALILAEKKQALDEALVLAESAYKDAPSVRPSDTFAWILHLRGEDKRATEVLKPVLEQGSQNPLVLYHAGSIAQSLGKSEEARRLLARCLEINPGFDPVAAREAQKRLAPSR